MLSALCGNLRGPLSAAASRFMYCAMYNSLPAQGPVHGHSNRSLEQYMRCSLADQEWRLVLALVVGPGRGHCLLESLQQDADDELANGAPV